MIALNVVALVFVLLHTVTWFGLTPQAMAVRVMGRKVPAFGTSSPGSTPAWWWSPGSCSGW